MKTPFLGLRTTIYKVGNVDEARQWYSKILGIEPYFNEPFYVGFNVAGYELGLQPDNYTGVTSDNITTYWGVENIEAAYQNLISLGAVAHEVPTNVGDEIYVAAVKDPWNNILGIIQNPHFTLI